MQLPYTRPASRAYSANRRLGSDSSVPSLPGWTTVTPCSAVHRLRLLMHCSERRTTSPKSSASEEVEPTPNHFSGRSTGCQSSIEWHTRWRRWRSRRCPPQRQLNNLIQTAVPVRPLRLSDAPLLIVPKTQTEFAHRSFSVAGPHTWNSLPSDVTIQYNTIQVY